MSQARVALLIETSLGYGRGLLRGIVEYARHYGPWAFYVTPGDLVQRVPKLVEWGATGVIARIWTPQVAQAILNTGLPVIALDLDQDQIVPGNPLAEICEVCPDGFQAGCLAAEHLIDRGFQRFAFVGAPDDPLWSARRKEGFLDRIRAAGFECQVYPVPKSRLRREWAKQQQALGSWLSSFARPLGVLACDDERGHEVVEACRAAALCVPEDVAILGVDNDDLLCELCNPPLSSVALDTKRAGYQTAALLDQLMQQECSGKQQILVPPTGVVTRRSTDVFALEDRDLAMALRFIHDHAAQPIDVSQVVSHVCLSRRSLELRFQKTLGRTIHQEIVRCRVKRAQVLLLETERTIGEIAEAAGFGAAGQLHRAFQHQLGCTPGEWLAQASHWEPLRNS